MEDKHNTTPDTELDQDVYEALLSAGLLFPETPAEVEEAEKEMGATKMAIPARLADPSTVFSEITAPEAPADNRHPIAFPCSSEAANGLARAAREGKDIDQDLADRMKRDRRAAEEKEDGE